MIVRSYFKLDCIVVVDSCDVTLLHDRLELVQHVVSERKVYLQLVDIVIQNLELPPVQVRTQHSPEVATMILAL